MFLSLTRSFRIPCRPVLETCVGLNASTDSQFRGACTSASDYFKGLTGVRVAIG
jgi:hypothetical protein